MVVVSGRGSAGVGVAARGGSWLGMDCGDAEGLGQDLLQRNALSECRELASGVALAEREKSLGQPLRAPRLVINGPGLCVSLAETTNGAPHQTRQQGRPERDKSCAFHKYHKRYEPKLLSIT